MSNTIRCLKCCLVVIMLFLSACSLTKKIHIVDENNQPIAGALVMSEKTVNDGAMIGLPFTMKKTIFLSGKDGKASILKSHNFLFIYKPGHTYFYMPNFSLSYQERLQYRVSHDKITLKRISDNPFVFGHDTVQCKMVGSNKLSEDTACQQLQQIFTVQIKGDKAFLKAQEKWQLARAKTCLKKVDANRKFVDELQYDVLDGTDKNKHIFYAKQASTQQILAIITALNPKKQKYTVIYAPMNFCYNFVLDSESYWSQEIKKRNFSSVRFEGDYDHYQPKIISNLSKQKIEDIFTEYLDAQCGSQFFDISNMQ